MNQPEAAQSSTQTPAARNVGSIPITRSPSQNATPAGKPGKTWEDHDTAWESKFVLPLAEFMKQRGVQHVRVDLSGGTVKYALIPFNDPVQIFELVDATSEEQYFPLGVFFDAASAVLKAQDHFPQRWDGDHIGQAVSEVRARKIGLYGSSYAVLWRGEWHYDYDAGGVWKLVAQQLGTLEKPLPITRA